MRLSEAVWQGTLEEARAGARAGCYCIKDRHIGLFVPARIFRQVANDPVTGERLDRSPHLWAEINDRDVDPGIVALYGKPITEDEWEWLKALTSIRLRKPRP